MSGSTRIHIFPTPNGVAQYAARTLREVCGPGDSRKVAVALSGGSTPTLLYKILANDFRDEIAWERLELFFSDERAVPPDHADSNYRLALHELISKVPIAAEQVHRMPADARDAEEAARLHEEEILRVVPAGPLGDPTFDLIWLGVGEDGHTASLFPGTAALGITENLIAPNEVPQLKTRRMTFTYPLLNSARRVQFLVVGAKKAPVVRSILGPPEEGGPIAAFPAARVRPAYGVLDWLLDRDAAAEIEDRGLIA
jgi:6-phosphogluconolactonase